MRIVYFGFDLFYDCFEYLVNDKNTEITALHTFKTDNVFEFNEKTVTLANKAGIPVYYDKPDALKIENYFLNGCDALICAGYIYKIPIPKSQNFKGVNVHPALLPVGRGAWPYPCTILKGLKKSGVTLHKIAEGFDEGDIILQKSYPVSDNETLDSLTRKSQTAAVELLKKLFGNFDFYFSNATTQKNGEYWKEPSEKDYTITSDMTVNTAKRVIRAFGSFGVIYHNEVFKGKTENHKTVLLKDGKINLYY